jgi:L-lactate dehydrogenase complex protein LldE
LLKAPDFDFISRVIMKVTAFVTCLVDTIYPNVGVSMVKLLERLGVKVGFRREQTCCGQPAFNAGHWDEARMLAKNFLDLYENDEHIVVPSGSCTSMIKKFYHELFANKPSINERMEKLVPRVHELSDFLVNVMRVEDVGAVYNGKVTYHDSCHLLRELRLSAEPRRLIRAVRGATLCEMKESTTCCGFGGLFSVKFADISGGMLNDKIRSIQESGTDAVVATDMGCLMHIEGGLKRQSIPVRTMHIAELLVSDGH